MKSKFAARRVDSAVAPSEELPWACRGGLGALGSWITVAYCWDYWFPQ